MKIDRLLSIVILMLNRDRVTARELAEKYEVSIRTIYRDIETIDQAGIPVISYPGTAGGYGIDSHFRLDRQVLSLADITAMLSALKGIQSALDTRDLDTAIEKVGTLVPNSDAGARHEFDQKFAIDILPWGYQDRQRAAMRMVSRAVSSEKLLSFTYKNSGGAVKKRLVEPMTLIFKGYAWYVFGYCKIRNDFRVFRLSRMRDIAVEHRGFIRKDADWREYMTPPKNPAGESGSVEMVVWFSKKVVYRIEDYFADENITMLDDGSIEARFSFPPGDWIYSFLLSFGAEMKIIAPASIRREMQIQAEKIARSHSET